MTTLTLQNREGYYWPVTDGDRFLLQHVTNENYIAINKNELEKVMFVAKAHGWEVVVV